MRAILLSSALLAGLSTAGAAQETAAVQGLADAFAAALNAGDGAALAELYREDAVILPPGAEMISGREAIRSFWEQGMGTFEDIELTTVDVEPLGTDATREIGTFSFTTTGEQPQQVTGKYVVIWHRQGDAWKIGTDIWNMNQ